MQLVLVTADRDSITGCCRLEGGSHDYPYTTAFGHSGEGETADAVLGGEITTVMIEPGDDPPPR